MIYIYKFEYNIKQEKILNLYLTDRQNTSLQVLVQISFRLNNVAYLYLSD